MTKSEYEAEIARLQDLVAKFQRGEASDKFKRHGLRQHVPLEAERAGEGRAVAGVACPCRAAGRRSVRSGGVRGDRRNVMNRNIFAHTEPGSGYPAYVSINQKPDGDIEITVRSVPSEKDGHPVPGSLATATIPLRDWPKNWEMT